VIAAPIPLTSLTDDVAALRRTIERTRGPAGRMGAKTRSCSVDHTPLLTAPDQVVDIILEAAAAATT
jgi:hypothetical protein